MYAAEVGNFALISAVAVSLLGFMVGARLVWLKSDQSLELLRALTALVCALLVVSFSSLIWAFVTPDLSVDYVAAHASSMTPWHYRVSAAWGGHAGSLLLWVLILSAWSVLVAFIGLSRLPRLTLVRMLWVLQAVLLLMLLLVWLTSSPFERTNLFVPVDGRDLNPLLQHPGLVFHPPLLYLGYVGCSVPFAFAVAVLLKGRMDEQHAAWIKPWVLAAWGFLTFGIALGSWWAYSELGWGGWWFWDPVENASVMPWLVLTALAHSLNVSLKRGVFVTWSLLLCIAAFSLSLLGTFLVRSGVLTSVHAFALNPSVGAFVLLIIGLVTGSALVLFALKAPYFGSKNSYQPVSKEGFLAFNNLLLLTALLVVFLGTLYPILAEALGLGAVSVGPPYYNLMFVPLAWLVMLAMSVAPQVGWGSMQRSIFKPVLLIGTVSAVLGVSLAWVLAGFNLWLMVSFALVCWALLWMCLDLTRRLKFEPKTGSGRRIRASTWCMYLGHAGVLVLSTGAALSSQLSTETQKVLRVGEHAVVQGYKVTLTELSTLNAENFDADVATFKVFKNDQLLHTMQPQKRQYLAANQVTTEASMRRFGVSDLYVSLGRPVVTQGQLQGFSVRVYYKSGVHLIWWGAFMIGVSAFLAVIVSLRRGRAFHLKQDLKS